MIPVYLKHFKNTQIVPLEMCFCFNILQSNHYKIPLNVAALYTNIMLAEITFLDTALWEEDSFPST